MSQTITYYCAFCDAKETVEAPTTLSTYCGGDVVDALCPDHVDALGFLRDQCPGCVSGWGMCPMYMAIAHGRVSDDEIAAIRGGRCPHRVNGSFVVSVERGVAEEDMSVLSTHGEAMIRAIRDAEAKAERARAYLEDNRRR